MLIRCMHAMCSVTFLLFLWDMFTIALLGKLMVWSTQKICNISKFKALCTFLKMNHQFYMALCCLGRLGRTLECSLVDFKLWNWASSECKQKSYTLMPPCPTCAWHWQIADLLMYTCFFLRFKHMTRNISLAL